MTKTLRTLTLALAAAGCLGIVQAQGLRPEIGTPLQQASKLLQAGKAGAALAEVRKAEAVGNRTAAEQLTIDRMKAAAAQRAGDHGTAVQALNAVFGRVGGAEQAQTAEQLAFSYSQLRDWGRSREWIGKARSLGRDTPQMRQLEQYLLSQSGDYAAIARDAAAAVAAAEKARRAPDEGDLLRLADARQRLNDSAGYIATLEKLVAYHPKKDYWAAYLARLPRKSGFSPRLGLDVMRLRLATGTLETTEEFFEMAQLAIQAGLPAEGVRIIDKGFAEGKLGTGNADALVELGNVHVSIGETARGIALIEQGIAKGGLKRPEDAQLRLGLAQLQSPAHKAQGAKTLRSIKGGDGVAEIGRLWAVAAR